MKTTKKHIQRLKALADKIDALSIEKHGRKMTYQTKSKVSISHEDMKLSGQEPEEGKAYKMTCPIIGEVNHFRRLKSAFRANGVEGVQAHLKRCQITIEKEKLEKILSI